MPQVQTIPLDKLHLEDGFNPRSEYDTESIKSLAKSIHQNGLLSALTVVKNDDGFKVVAGHRRYLALKDINAAEVPCIVREDDADSLPAALVENIHRTDLTTGDICRGVARMKADQWTSQKAIAEKLAISQNQVKRALQLLELGDVAIDLVDEGVLSPNKLDVLTSLSQVDKRAAAAVLRNMSDQREVSPHIVNRLADDPVRFLGDYYNDDEGRPLIFILDYSYDVQDLPLSEEGEDLLTTYRSELGAEPQFVVTEDVILAAKARGAVWEFKDPKATESIDRSTRAFFDRELAGIIAVDQLKEWFSDHKAKAEAVAAGEPMDDDEEAEVEKAIAPKVERDNYGNPVDPEAEKEARKKAREKRIADQQKGEAYNAELSKQVFERIQEVPVTVKNLMPVIAMALRDGDEYLMNGLRYLHPGWTTEEGEGARRKKVYLPKEKAVEKVVETLKQANTPEELLARFVQIVTANAYADERVLAKTNRTAPPQTFHPDSIPGKVFKDLRPSEIGLRMLTPKMKQSAESNVRSRAQDQ